MDEQPGETSASGLGAAHTTSTVARLWKAPADTSHTRHARSDAMTRGLLALSRVPLSRVRGANAPRVGGDAGGAVRQYKARGRSAGHGHMHVCMCGQVDEGHRCRCPGRTCDVQIAIMCACIDRHALLACGDAWACVLAQLPEVAFTPRQCPALLCQRHGVRRCHTQSGAVGGACICTCMGMYI